VFIETVTLFGRFSSELDQKKYANISTFPTGDIFR